jgi:hypothetical protein
LLVARAAGAEPHVDWARGLVIADGIGVADRHAPNPAVARGTARRPAEDAAKRALRAAVLALPVAGGGKVGDRARDEAVAARLDRAVDAAFALAAEPETDGAWRVTMAVPIEAVHQALLGAPRVLASGDHDPPVVVVQVAGAAPAVGWQVGGLDAATVWVSELPTYAKSAPRLRAKAIKPGALEVEGMQGGTATLFVLLRPK